MKFNLVESFGSIESEVVKDYRKYANIDPSVKLTEEIIDEWALNEAACKHGMQTYDLKHMLLTEDSEGTTIDQAARELDAEKEVVKKKGQVVSILDDSLEQALEMQEDGDDSDFPNVLLISEAGFGKTEIVRQWAKANNINLFEYNLGQASGEDFGGIVARDDEDRKHATRLTTKNLTQALSRPRSVLFLDEYNRSRTEIRGAVLTLIQNHKFFDPNAEDGFVYLDNFLFTIAAINPSDYRYKGAKEMDMAELTRFRAIEVNPNPKEHLDFLTGFYQGKIDRASDDARKMKYQGMLDMATKILTDSRLKYDNYKDAENMEDDRAYRALNYRSFKKAIDASKGTKDGLLHVWNDFCNYKKKNTIDTILGDYVDVADRANQAIKDHDTQSDVFGSASTGDDKFNRLGDLIGGWDS